jgi:hypothetical protein
MAELGIVNRSVTSESMKNSELRSREQNLIFRTGRGLNVFGEAKLNEADSLIDWHSRISDWQISIFVGLLVGYVCLSLDAGYKWLRKRQAAKAPEA